MKQQQFDDLIKGTKFGRSRGSDKSLRAAALHFVDGIKNVKECAEQVGVTRQSAQHTIAQLKKLIDEKNMEAVFVLVPKGQKARIETLARSLSQEQK